MSPPSKAPPPITLGSPLFLTGYRACGKTSVARRLSERLGVPMVDLDAEIVTAAGKTIAEIFADSGEAGFRLLETEQLSRFTSAEIKSGAAVTPLIVSLGGGAILREANRAMIASTGPCVWLDADAATIVARLAEDLTTEDQRPDLTALPMDQEVQQLLETRKPLYEAVSQLRIDTSALSIEQICDEILSWLESRAAACEAP